MTGLYTRKSVHVVTAALLTVAAALLLPLFFHLLPASDGPPLGARLLPIFYAPLLAAVFFHPAVALTAALSAPALNHLLTGRPTPDMAMFLTLELLLFVGVVLLAKGRMPRLPVVAPVAYVLAHLVAGTVLGRPWEMSLASLTMALPGMGVLFVLNVLVDLIQRREATR